MKIAIVLFGQPREHIKGYNAIMSFINKHKDCEFDFFYHCWKLNENEEFKHSPWRRIDRNKLIFTENILTELQELYKPILYEVENQNNIMFDDILYRDTLAFTNTNSVNLNNINNTLFQLYSRNKARNILDRYLKEMNDRVNYDFVLFTRFDIGIMPEISFNKIEKSKTYVSNCLYPRKIMPDQCIIMSTETFLEWFNDIYYNLRDLLDNKEVSEIVIKSNESFSINQEEILFSKYLFHYKNTNNIDYFKGGVY